MKLTIDTVLERDIDLLVIEQLSNDKEFINIFIDDEEVRNVVGTFKECKIVGVSHSVKEEEGESDIFFNAKFDGNEFGFYIENKIDAPAMPGQYKRYEARAKKKYKDGNYFIFMICSQKYHEANAEAKKYKYVEYEKIAEYLKDKNTYAYNMFNYAINKSKARGDLSVNINQRNFLAKYIEYQNKYHHDCSVITDPSKSNGGWVEFNRASTSRNIRHKLREGEVALDLYFNDLDNNEKFDSVFDYLRTYGHENIIKMNKTTTKCCSIVIKVPKLDNNSDFEKVDKKDLDACFKAIKELKEIEKFIDVVQKSVK